MPFDLSNLLVVGISSRSLFDLREEDRIYQEEGLDAFRAHQLAHEKDVLAPGPGFALVKALLGLNGLLDGRQVEVVVMSRNSTETSLRIFNSIAHHGLDITRAALSGGAPLSPYLRAFSVDLFLSQDEADVAAGIREGIASAILFGAPEQVHDHGQIRVAFDGDAVVFSDEAERIYQEQGLEAFIRHESENAKRPLPEGPFAKLLRLLAGLQKKFPAGQSPIRTALVTARAAPSHERVVRTLSSWGVSFDEAFFLGGAGKAPVLEAFRPHIFFDDQLAHCEPASKVVQTGRVPNGVAK